MIIVCGYGQKVDLDGMKETDLVNYLKVKNPAGEEVEVNVTQEDLQRIIALWNKNEVEINPPAEQEEDFAEAPFEVPQVDDGDTPDGAFPFGE